MSNLIISKFIDTMANIEYGLLVAIVIVAILLFVITSVNSKNKLNVLSYIIAAALLVPLAFQMSCLIGACQISDTVSAINDIAGTISPTLSKYVSSATNHDIGWFVFRRILWSVVFIGVSGFGIYVTMTPRRRKSYSTYEDYNSNVSNSTGDWGF